MLYARGPLRTLHFAAILAIASASSVRPELLFERDGTCAAGFTKCSQAGLPSDFCCAQGTSCLVLAGGTTVLCCPGGNDCGTIEIISCNISLQDPAANPTAEVKTTALDEKLPTCGKGCCPFGYHCNTAADNCVKDTDQSKKPGDTPSSSSSSTHSSATSAHSSPTTSRSSVTTAHSSLTTIHSSPTTLTTHKSTTTTTAAGAGGGQETAIPSTETPTTTAAHTLNIAAIVGGVVGGIVLISLIAGGVWLMRHKRKKVEIVQDDSTSSFGNIISAPIPHADYHTQRLDFLAKAQSSSVATSPRQAQERFPPTSPYSPYGGYGFRPESQMSELSRSHYPSPRSHHASAEVGGLRNLTDRYSGGSTMTSSSARGANPLATRSGRQHSGGSESINIFADPSTVGTPPPSRDRRDTTWTDFQHPESPVRRRY
jgi:hypothetical protein